MTLSATNSLLYTLTKRKSDLEYKSQTTNQKRNMPIAQQTNIKNNQTNVPKAKSEPQINKELSDVRKYINQNTNKNFNTNVSSEIADVKAIINKNLLKNNFKTFG